MNDKLPATRSRLLRFSDFLLISVGKFSLYVWRDRCVMTEGHFKTGSSFCNAAEGGSVLVHFSVWNQCVYYGKLSLCVHAFYDAPAHLQITHNISGQLV